jgi:hypothetical protein
MGSWVFGTFWWEKKCVQKNLIYQHSFDNNLEGKRMGGKHWIFTRQTGFTIISTSFISLGGAILHGEAQCTWHLFYFID